MNKAQGTTCCPICTKPTPHGHDIKRWIGVDFDATLAYDIPNRTDLYELGKPIPEMVNRVRDWIGKGFTVKILTARMNKYSHLGFERDVEKMRDLLKAWSREHIGIALECTNIKDGFMEVLWDDRAVQVSRDTAYPIAYELDAVKQQLNAANQRNKELQSENETCRNLMRIKQEQNDAFSQRIAELEQRLNSFRDIEKRERLLMERVAELEERIRVADAEEPKLLPPVTMEKALTVLMQTDDGDNEAERYLANIDDGCAFVVTKSEMFFHQLRLSVAKNPEIANKVSVLFYQDGEYKKVGLGYEDELRWPVGFLEGAWSMEIEISKVREAIRKNADQPKKN